MNVFNLVLGAVVVEIGLSFWWALIAIGVVIQAQSLQGVAGSLSIPAWIGILVIPAVIIGIFRYRWIHRVMQVTAVLAGVSLVVMFAQGLAYGSLPAHETAMTAPPAGLFLAGMALLVIDMLSFGPFVSDYSRYLPADTSGRRLFWCIYGGNVLATFMACAVGAHLAALLPSLGPVAAAGKVSGKWALVIMALSLVNSDTVNAYTGAFQLLSFGNMWRRLRPNSTTLRVVPFLVVMAIGAVIALLGYGSFVANLSDFLDVLLLIFIPWSAVNLTDYFVVRRASYDVASFFTSPSRTTPVRWSVTWAGPTSPGWSAGSSPPASTCC